MVAVDHTHYGHVYMCAVSSETAKVWSLDPADDNLVSAVLRHDNLLLHLYLSLLPSSDNDHQDLLDSDTLLEEEDMIKPDPASLRSMSYYSLRELVICTIVII